MKRPIDADLSQLLIYFIKITIIWSPILVGVIHQIVMLFGRGSEDVTKYDPIPVFLDPPGTISPFVTLEYQWWLVLTFVTALFFFLILFRHLSNLPRRFAVPFYVYLLYLLIWVKPI